MIDDIEVTRHIIERFSKQFGESLNIDVAIAGAGPAGMVAAKYLADAGKSVTIFERKLSPGGGMWGGGMTFPVIVIQEKSLSILDEFGIKYEDAGNGYFTADSIEATSKLCAGCMSAGAKMFNTMSVEDVVIRDKDDIRRVSGFVINWSAVEMAGLHVDPLSIGAKVCIDATGHPTEVCKVVIRKAGKLNTPNGDLEGEKSMWAEIGEQTVVENTKEVFPGLYVAGMASNAVYGAPRMGPIFGGMLLSGKKVADMILKELD